MLDVGRVVEVVREMVMGAATEMVDVGRVVGAVIEMVGTVVTEVVTDAAKVVMETVVEVASTGRVVVKAAIVLMGRLY